MLIRHCGRAVLRSLRRPADGRHDHALRCQLRSATTTAHSCKRPPATVGIKLSDVDTPALLVDMDVMERNCAKLKNTMSQFPLVTVRPHCKAHKSPDLALWQLKALGVTGVCCQKVSEAEAMAAGGVLDILLTNEVIARRKLERLVGLAADGVRVGLCFETAQNLRDINAEASRQGTLIDVLVEVNVGQDRCGVDSPAEALSLAQLAGTLDAVRWRGIQAYHGGIQHVRQPADRQRSVNQVAERARAVVQTLQYAGVSCPVVTGGGSGTWQGDAASGVFTEVQPGSFIFGDADYAKNVYQDGGWDQSLWVLAQVVSRNEGRGLAVIDAGLKAFSLDSGPPVLPTRYSHGVQVEFQNGGDEHGKLLWPLAVHQMPNDIPALGTLLQLQPGHCDPTVNLYDHLVAVRGGIVQHVWPISARGPGV